MKETSSDQSNTSGCWATVLIDPETFEPREATEGELEELADLGIPVERCWIAPGPEDRRS